MKPETILVVDDNEDDVFLLKHAFRASQIINPLQFLDNGDAAIAYLEGSGQFADRSQYPSPAFLLLDLNLPSQTGFHILEWLRHNPQPGLKVIVCTGTASPQEKELACRLGAERIFEKSADFPGFVKQLTSLPGVHVESCPEGQQLVFASAHAALAGD